MKGKRSACPTDSVLMTIQEAGASLRFSDTFVYSLIERGELKAIRVGDKGILRVRRSDLHEWAAKQQTTVDAGAAALRESVSA